MGGYLCIFFPSSVSSALKPHYYLFMQPPISFFFFLFFFVPLSREVRSENWVDCFYLTLLLLVITDEPYLRATRDMCKNRLKVVFPNQSPNTPEGTIHKLGNLSGGQ